MFTIVITGDPATRVALIRDAKINDMLKKDKTVTPEEWPAVRDALALNPTLYAPFTREHEPINARTVLASVQNASYKE